MFSSNGKETNSETPKIQLKQKIKPRPQNQTEKIESRTRNNPKKPAEQHHGTIKEYYSVHAMQRLKKDKYKRTCALLFNGGS